MILILNLWHVNVQVKETPEHGNAMSWSRVNVQHWRNQKELLRKAEKSNQKACCGPKLRNFNSSDKK